MRLPFATVIFFIVCGNAVAEEINYPRAQYNYQMFCQGCHAPQGLGSPSVPRMKDHVGNFLRTANGREYLVRVPGSATSSLADDQLAEVLNWMMLEIAGDSVRPGFEHYTATEVGRLRQHPLNEVEQYRVQLLIEIAALETGD